MLFGKYEILIEVEIVMKNCNFNTDVYRFLFDILWIKNNLNA